MREIHFIQWEYSTTPLRRTLVREGVRDEREVAPVPDEPVDVADGVLHARDVGERVARSESLEARRASRTCWRDGEALTWAEYLKA